MVVVGTMEFYLGTIGKPFYLIFMNEIYLIIEHSSTKLNFITQFWRFGEELYIFSLNLNLVKVFFILGMIIVAAAAVPPTPIQSCCLEGEVYGIPITHANSECLVVMSCG